MALTKITSGVIKANENYDTHNINSTGIVTAVSANFTGDVSIGGTLTYQDVTNIDSVGVVTARSGIHVTGGSVGIGTDTIDANSQLHIKNTSGNAKITLETNETYDSYINFSGASSEASIGYEPTNNAVIISNAADGLTSAERFRITSGGRIGINETSPDVLLHLTETNADPFNTVITHLKLNNGGGNGGSGSRIELKTGAARCWIQSFIDGANSNSGGALVFGTPSSGALGTERLRIHSHGQLELKVPDANPALKITPSGTNAPAAIDFNTPGTGVAKLLVQGTERLRIDSGGRIAQGGRTSTNHGSPNLLLWGADPTLHISATGSTANTSFAGIKFAVAGGSTGDYSKAGIFVQRQDSYNDLDMIFAFRSSNDATGVSVSDEKIRIDSDGRLLVNTTSSRIVEDWSGNGPQGRIQIEQTNSNALMSIISAGTADANRAGTLVLGRHRNSTIGGTPTIVQSGDHTGAIVFAGGDGSDMRSKSAVITSRVGATPGSSKIPGDLLFLTTNTDDGDQPEERLIIDHRASFLRRYRRLATTGVYNPGGTRGYNSSATGTVRLPGSEGDTFYFSVTMPSYYASGSIPQTIKASIQYATYHASGYGAGEYLIHQKHGANGGRRLDVLHFRKLSEVYAGGWYYGMNTNFTTRLYETTNDEASASIVFRVQVRTGNGSTYDGSAHLHIKIETLGGWATHPEPRITWHGTSSPSGLGSEVSATTLSWP